MSRVSHVTIIFNYRQSIRTDEIITIIYILILSFAM